MTDVQLTQWLRHSVIMTLSIWYLWPVACLRPKPGPLAARADRLGAYNNDSRVNVNTARSNK